MGRLSPCARTPVGQVVTVGSRRVHYLQMGSGPDLVLLHGASGNLRDWTMGQMERMARDWRVTAFDRPGAGFTDRGQDMHDPRRQASVMQAASAALGLRRPVVLGHSYGGTVALAWGLAAQEHLAGLCLMAAPSHVWPGSVGRLYELADHPLLGPLVAWAYPRLASDRLVDQGIRNVFRPEAPPEGYRDGLCADLALRYGTVRANMADINRLKPIIARMVPRYGSLTLPVEILHGDRDAVVPFDIHSRHLAPVLPNGRLTILENAGHMPHHTRKEEMFAALARLREG